MVSLQTIYYSYYWRNLWFTCVLGSSITSEITKVSSRHAYLNQEHTIHSRHTSNFCSLDRNISTALNRYQRRVTSFNQIHPNCLTNGVSSSFSQLLNIWIYYHVIITLKEEGFTIRHSSEVLLIDAAALGLWRLSAHGGNKCEGHLFNPMVVREPGSRKKDGGPHIASKHTPKWLISWRFHPLPVFHGTVNKSLQHGPLLHISSPSNSDFRRNTEEWNAGFDLWLFYIIFKISWVFTITLYLVCLNSLLLWRHYFNNLIFTIHL